jgi:hypothetical protein
MPSLDSTTYVANNGINEQKTIREVIALGGGKAFDVLSTKPYWNDLMAAYVAEQTNPQGVLEEKVYKAYATMKSAEWWFNVGMGEATSHFEEMCPVWPTPSEAQWNDAHDAWSTAVSRYDELKAKLDRLVEKLNADWRDLFVQRGPCEMKPEGTVLVAMPHTKSTVLLPLFPWPQSDNEVTTFFTPPEGDEDNTPHAASPVTYPNQTKLAAAYILADTPGLQTLKAVVTQDGVLQLKPRTHFDSVEAWVSSLPYVVAGTMTVTLPKPTAGMKERVTVFANRLNWGPLSIVDKIKAIYAEFGLKSVATLSPQAHTPDWTTCVSVTPIKDGGSIVGEFARYSDLELFAVGDTSAPVVPCGDMLYVGRKLVNSLEDFAFGSTVRHVCFQMRWKTQKTRRSAGFILDLDA